MTKIYTGSSYYSNGKTTAFDPWHGITTEFHWDKQRVDIFRVLNRERKEPWGYRYPSGSQLYKER